MLACHGALLQLRGAEAGEADDQISTNQGDEALDPSLDCRHRRRKAMQVTAPATAHTPFRCPRVV